MNFKWAVVLMGESFNATYLYKTRKEARRCKSLQKRGFINFKDVKITLRKVMIGETTGTLMIGQKEYY